MEALEAGAAFSPGSAILAHSATQEASGDVYFIFELAICAARFRLPRASPVHATLPPPALYVKLPPPSVSSVELRHKASRISDATLMKVRQLFSLTGCPALSQVYQRMCAGPASTSKHRPPLRDHRGDPVGSRHLENNFARRSPISAGGALDSWARSEAQCSFG